MSEKISIIMPVYNSESYVKESVQSILNQTLKDFELLVINDGSNDNSLNIVNELSKFDNRIKVFSITNSGSAVARNYGLKRATGEYIGFVDSDDVIKTDMFEKLYKTAEQYKCEITSCSFEVINKKENVVKEKVKFPEGYYNKKDIRNILYPELIASKDISNYFPNTMWTKIFSRKLIVENDIWFCPELKFGQDIIFTTKAFLHCDSFYYMPKSRLYRYRFNDQSTTNSYIQNCWDKSIIINNELLQMTKYHNYNFNDQLPYQVVKSAISAINNEGKDITNGNCRMRLDNIYSIINDERVTQSIKTVSPKYFSRLKTIIFYLIKHKKAKTLLISAKLYNVL